MSRDIGYNRQRLQPARKYTRNGAVEERETVASKSGLDTIKGSIAAAQDPTGNSIEQNPRVSNSKSK